MVERRYHDDELMEGTPFEAVLPGGALRQGVVNGAGQALIADVPAGSSVEIRFGQMPGAYRPKDQRPMPDHDAMPAASRIDALMDKYAEAAQ